MARRGMGIGTLLLLGGAAWLLFGRKAAAAPVVSAGGGTNMPAPQAGETSEAYADRLKAWGLATGQAYPTMEGYGSSREWYSWQANGPSGTLHGGSW